MDVSFSAACAAMAACTISAAANIPDLTDIQIYNHVIYATLVLTLWGENLPLSNSNGFLRLCPSLPMHCSHFLPTFSLTPCALNICAVSALQSMASIPKAGIKPCMCTPFAPLAYIHHFLCLSPTIWFGKALRC